MKIHVTFFVSILSLSTFAGVIESHIHSIETLQNSNGKLIKFSNGEVAFIEGEAMDLEEELIKASGRKELIQARIDGQLTLKSAQSIASHKKRKEASLKQLRLNASYEPSVVDVKEAKTIFNRLNSNYVRGSECSNRAHVWAHEEYTRHGIRSMKAFLFFTSSYIQRNRFKWWFHVAPMLQVRHQGKVEAFVLDYMFNHEPVSLQEWKDQFVFSRKNCKLDGTFTEYDQRADQTQDCYLITRPMYYWMPGDLSAEENSNLSKDEFGPSEVRAAYGEAFSSTQRNIP